MDLVGITFIKGRIRTAGTIVGGFDDHRLPSCRR